MIWFVIDGAFVVDDVDCSEALTEVEEGLLHCVSDCLRLVLHCEVEILGVFSELVEDYNGVFDAKFGLLLELLNTSDDLSCEAASLKGLVLSGVEQNSE